MVCFVTWRRQCTMTMTMAVLNKARQSATTMKCNDSDDDEEMQRRWRSDAQREAWRQRSMTTCIDVAWRWTTMARSYYYRANESRICQLTYDCDFNFNDMQINFNDVPVTKHDAQTSGAQMSRRPNGERSNGGAETTAPKWRWPNIMYLYSTYQLLQHCTIATITNPNLNNQHWYMFWCSSLISSTSRTLACYLLFHSGIWW